MLSYLHVSFFKIKNHESTGVMHAGGMLYSKSIVTSRLSWDVMSLHVSNHLDSILSFIRNGESIHFLQKRNS